MEKKTKNRRKFGQHFTSKDIFHEFIFPQIQDDLHNYLWVDCYGGEGNLLFPILDYIPAEEKVRFFQENMFLFDIQDHCLQKAIENAQSYGIPLEIAERNIRHNDSLRNLPKILKSNSKPIFHITNPPYLYLGYIAKHPETQNYLELFTKERDGFQDLYQIALYNDLIRQVNRLIYVIPTNFLFGNAVSNKFRDIFLKEFTIENAFLFEKKIFEHTGMNVGVFTFTKKKESNQNIQKFTAIRVNSKLTEQKFYLNPKYHYKAGTAFEEFIEEYRTQKPLNFQYYLLKKHILENPGQVNVSVIDANNYKGTNYQEIQIATNKLLADKIRKNILWIRTVDTGNWEGRVGLYEIFPSFGVEGILVTKNTYRTNPIQIFFDPPLSTSDQQMLMKYHNLILEYLREQTESNFMTTYKYATANYIRKYFGLSQVRKLIYTCPIQALSREEKKIFKTYLDSEDIPNILKMCKKYSL